MEFSHHHSKAFIAAFKRVMKVANKSGTEEAKITFRDEMLALGHLERVRNLYRVKDKVSSKAVFFVPNRGQEKYLRERRGSDQILKARQVGFTTLSCIRALDMALWEPNVSTGILAHEQNKVTTIFADITKFCYNAFKNDWAHLYSPTETSDSATALTFRDDGLGRPLNSSMRVLYDFRGKTVQFLHVSEAAFIDNARLNGSLNGVPDNGETVLESTANGMGGEFYRQWQAGKKLGSLAPFKGHFIPWFEHYPEEPEKWLLPDDAILSEYEKSLLEHGLTEAHIAWRRSTMEKKCQGDPEVFEQEYPSNDIDCFLNGQNLVFGSSIIKNQIKNTRPSTKKGLLLSDGMGGVELHEDAKGFVDVWELPDAACDYVIGADPSGGIGKDNGAAYVLNRKSGKYCARIWGQLEPHDFAQELWKLANYYNKAWICIEANNHGHAVIDAIKGKNYRNLYKRKALDEITNQLTNKVGFLTTNQSKLAITEAFKTGCKEGVVFLLDNDLIAEMSTFIQLASKTGVSIRREASAGAHDDLVMAACLTWEMHLSRGTSTKNEELPSSAQYDEETGFLISNS